MTVSPPDKGREQSEFTRALARHPIGSGDLPGIGLVAGTALAATGKKELLRCFRI